MDRDQYRQSIQQMWIIGQQLAALRPLNLEIAARRWGTNEELRAVTALRRALEGFPKASKQP